MVRVFRIIPLTRKNMTKRFLLFLICAAVAFASCSQDNMPKTDGSTDSTEVAALNWADNALWYEGDKRLPATDAAQVDVFYLLPTCLTAWADADGATHYNADPSQASHREAWRLSAELADTIFATRANLFLPYYRQVVFDALEGEHSAAAYAMATKDVTDAFDYYMAHYNGGRRFILAGYSQGGQMVKTLLKHMDDATYSRMIAAYIVGFGVTAADTAAQSGHRTSHIRLAQGETDKGVTIAFNSVTTPEAISPLLCRDNIACINPVSWTTSSTPAVLLTAGETPKADDARFPYGTAVVANQSDADVTVSVDAANHVLRVDNIDASRYFLPALQSFFSVGNLHLQELFFYGESLRANVIKRSKID